MAYDDTFDVHEAFRAKQDQMRGLLEVGRKIGPHPVAVGDGTELNWIGLFDDFLPSRYSVSKGFVVDSNGKCSKQIDVIIFDRTFSPLLWNYGGHLYVPAESVYAVFEIKQDLSAAHMDAAAEKVKSVRDLERTQGEFGWIGGKATKKPFDILGGLLTVDSTWSPAFGDAFYSSLDKHKGNEKVDLGCSLADGSWDFEDPSDVRGATIGQADKSLVSFCMHFLYRLQKMGTVGGIDYKAYERSANLAIEIVPSKI